MNGKRVAQLLASEIEGHEGRGLGGLAVVDADRGAEPTPDGTRAYAVAESEGEGGNESDGERVAVVDIYPEHAGLAFPGTEGVELETARGEGLTVEEGEIRLPDGASVKRALRVLARE